VNKTFTGLAIMICRSTCCYVVEH